MPRRHLGGIHTIKLLKQKDEVITAVVQNNGIVDFYQENGAFKCTRKCNFDGTICDLSKTMSKSTEILSILVKNDLSFSLHSLCNDLSGFVLDHELKNVRAIGGFIH